jgi:hypothetical protein
MQLLQNRVIRTTGYVPRRMSVRDMHLAFQVPYVCDYVTKLRRKQAELNHENVRNIGKGETPQKI